MKMLLQNEIVSNNALSDEAIVAYIALKAIHKKDCKNYFVTAQQLSAVISGSLSMSRKYMERIESGLQELIDSSIAVVVENKSKSYILDLSVLDELTTFTEIEIEDIVSIYNIDTRMDKFSLIRYYWALISTISYTTDFAGRKNFVGFVSMAYISNLALVSTVTADKYNKLLEQEEMIYIVRSKAERNAQGQWTVPNNVYGRYKDREWIESYAVDRQNTVEYAKLSKNLKDSHRALAAKYNWLCKGREYDDDTIKQIYNYIRFVNNQIYRQLPTLSETVQAEEKARLRDLSVFDKYDFIDRSGELTEPVVLETREADKQSDTKTDTDTKTESNTKTETDDDWDWIDDVPEPNGERGLYSLSDILYSSEPKTAPRGCHFYGDVEESEPEKKGLQYNDIYGDGDDDDDDDWRDEMELPFA